MGKRSSVGAAVSRFFREVLLYSGQFALFYTLSGFAAGGTAFFSDTGTIVLLSVAFVQAVFLSAYGGLPLPRIILSMLTPFTYTVFALRSPEVFALSPAMAGFWAFGLAFGLLGALSLAFSGRIAARFFEALIVFLNMTAFLLTWYWLELGAAGFPSDPASFIARLTGLPRSPSDFFLLAGSLLLALAFATGRTGLAPFTGKARDHRPSNSYRARDMETLYRERAKKERKARKGRKPELMPETAERAMQESAAQVPARESLSQSDIAPESAPAQAKSPEIGQLTEPAVAVTAADTAAEDDDFGAAPEAEGESAAEKDLQASSEGEPAAEPGAAAASPEAATRLADDDDDELRFDDLDSFDDEDLDFPELVRHDLASGYGTGPGSAVAGQEKFPAGYREYCVLHAGLWGLTELVGAIDVSASGADSDSDSASPLGTVDMLAEYFAEWSLCAEDFGGFPASVAGGSVVLLFGSEGSANPCRAAVECAISMRARWPSVRTRLSMGGATVPERFGVGIALGPLLVGEVRAGNAVTLGAIGAPATEAARLVAAHERVHNDFCLTGEVMERIELNLQERFVRLGSLGNRESLRQSAFYGIKSS